MLADSSCYDEKRAATRYSLMLAVEFEGGSGMTVDVSSGGACIETDQFIPCGEQISFRLMHPFYRENDPSRVSCIGKVVRTEPCGLSWRLAVCTDNIHFEA